MFLRFNHILPEAIDQSILPFQSDHKRVISGEALRLLPLRLDHRFSRLIHIAPEAVFTDGVEGGGSLFLRETGEEGEEKKQGEDQ